MGDAAVNVTNKLGFFKALRGEFKKIVWPKFPTLMKQTWIVIFVSLVLGGVVALIDLLYSAGVKFLLG